MWWIALAGVVLLAAAAWGPLASRVEQPRYAVVEKADNFEIRDYAPMIVAEANVTGDQQEAIRAGFRIIADYIFGNNLSSRKIPMTAPVMQRAGEKIAMTAPVTQQREASSWRVRFVMPASYTIEALPRPGNPAVRLEVIEGKRFAVIRFSGRADERRLRRRTDELLELVRSKRLAAVSAPTFAFYNPPWTLPLLRRNEVMIELSR